MTTPGPWVASYDKTASGLPSWRIDSRELSCMATLTYSPPVSLEDAHLAMEIAANAALVASAPDLLAALRGLLANPANQDAADAARRAIGRAEGVTP